MFAVFIRNAAATPKKQLLFDVRSYIPVTMAGMYRVNWNRGYELQRGSVTVFTSKLELVYRYRELRMAVD